MEREYVTSQISLRELCRKHGISAHSVVVDQARKGKWAEKREQYQARASESFISRHADRMADREAQVRDKALDAIDEAITKFRADLRATLDELDAVARPQGIKIISSGTHPFGIARHRLGQDLHRDPAAQLHILREIHLPHPTRPKRSEDLVRTELTTDTYHQPYSLVAVQPKKRVRSRRYFEHLVLSLPRTLVARSIIRK